MTFDATPPVAPQRKAVATTPHGKMLTHSKNHAPAQERKVVEPEQVIPLDDDDLGDF